MTYRLTPTEKQYDRRVSQRYDPTACVRFLASLAPGGTFVEFGIGTGRVALPLAATGAGVCGVDLSDGMLETLRQAPGADRIETTLGDMCTTALGRRFDVAYCVFNTLFYVGSQEEQLQILANSRSHIHAEGAVVIETEIIDFELFRRNGKVAPGYVTDGRVEFVCTTHDPATQTLHRAAVNFHGSTSDVSVNVLRYVWPAELDLMAKHAGMRLSARFGSWDGSPFTGAGTAISVYRPAGPPVRSANGHR